MSRADRILVAAAGGALVLVAAAAWLLLSPTLDAAEAVDEADPFAVATTLPSAPAASLATTIVVDVQGAVAEPGIRELPPGSRVADAIAAAGGYASDADLEAASERINLAEPLVDGGQVRVPRIGEAVAAASPPAGGPAPGSSDGNGSTGLVDLNTATPEELEALPGIGPVTVQKIVAARQERPFASLEDAVQRGVLNRGQLEDIQGLATAG